MSEEDETQESYNASEREDVNKARKRAAREEIIRAEAVRRVMADKDARAWINSILEASFMFGNPHVRGDVYETHINIGMANLGKMIWCEVEKAAPELSVMMLKEAKANEKS